MVVTGGPGRQLSGQHVSSLFCHPAPHWHSIAPDCPASTLHINDCVLVLIEETNVWVNVFSHLSLTSFARTHQAGVLLFYNFIIPSQSGEVCCCAEDLAKTTLRSNCQDFEITRRYRCNYCLFSDFSQVIPADFRLNLLFHPVTINVAQQMCSCMPVEYLCRYNVTWHREWLVLHFYF